MAEEHFSRTSSHLRQLSARASMGGEVEKTGWTLQETRQAVDPPRMINHIPVKALKFYSREKPPQFDYDNPIHLPIRPSKLVVQVSYVGLNPVDIKIMNGYAKHLSGKIGLGREYSGVISEVSDDLRHEWRVGEEVMGTFWHPNLGAGACETSILIDPNIDVIIRKPIALSMKEAGGTLYCLGASYTLLSSLEERGLLNSSSNILINGGTTSLGLFTIQLLKYHYMVKTKIVVVCSTKGACYLRVQFPDLIGDLVFVDYCSLSGDSVATQLKYLLSDGDADDYYAKSGALQAVQFDQGPFTVVLDYIGGYELIANSDSIVAPNGIYVSTVGDAVANYKTDVYKYWEAPAITARGLIGKVLWSFQYERFFFDPNAKYLVKNDWATACYDLLAARVVRTLVDSCYPWKDIRKALGYLSRGHAHGKVILEVEKF
ncbi:AaceriAGR373Cp [[Ashbya] aceris (nom. inval.)]|nr:AaceriAGR373Cp [[Ashbya] aceris (nom. inval.)]